MICIFISPNYPSGHWEYCAALRRAGFEILGVGDAGYETFQYGLRGNLSDYVRVGDLHNYDEVYRACASLIGKWGRPSRIESLNEYWSPLVDALRREFSVSCCLPDGIYAEKTSRRAEIQYLPEFETAVSARQAGDFAAEKGYPVLAVPMQDRKYGVHSVNDQKELGELIHKYGRGAFLLSAVRTGEPVSVDGYLRDGKAVFCTAHLRVSCGIYYSLPMTEALKERAAQCAAGVLSEKSGFFHIDAVRLPAAVKGLGKKNDIIFNNVSDAPPHEYIIDCMNSQYSVDIREVWALDGSEREGEISFPDEPKYCSAVVSRFFDRSYKNAHEKILRRLNIKLIRHTRTEEPDKHEFGDYVYIFVGESQAELRRQIKFITEDFAPCQ